MIGVDSKIAAVAGKHAGKLEKDLGVHTVGELLACYPRRYVDKATVSVLEGLREGDYLTCFGRVVAAEQKDYLDRRTHRTAYRLEALIATDGTELALTFFARKASVAKWHRDDLVIGRYGLFAGRLSRFRDDWQLTNPQRQMYGEHEAAADAFAAVPKLIPIYPATSGAQSWDIEAAVRIALDLVEDIPDVLPADLRRAEGLVDIRTALRGIHRPDSWAEKVTAEKRLKFDEAFVTQTALALRRTVTEATAATAREGRPDGLLAAFDARLPFALTAGQESVGKEILDELARPHPMHRLLQGEVGSGKTVVALRAMLCVVDAGGQAALLAPTEVLAQQHHRSITAMLGDLALGGQLGAGSDATSVALLTGSMGTTARKQALLDAASGEAGIVIGTHALLEEHVQFFDLGLVVVDEQHRFGVEQRAALGNKAEKPPHVLVMTATPIPRTVAMTVFGDLDTSTLVELPAGRATVQTSVVPVSAHPAWLERAWQRIREEVALGRQAYVVCPRIGAGASEEEASTESSLSAVEDIAPMLATGPLEALRVEALHGRMPPDEKDRAMRAFAAGDIDVLVSTTVIEVGVDVPNASVMVILDAERFGISQLHQLRGRIGRGGLPGLCLLVTETDPEAPSMQRLSAVAATSDGFELSRVDLAQRREGNVLGKEQSGRAHRQLLLSVLTDEDVITRAREVATELVAKDPDLKGSPDLRAAVDRLEDSERADFLEMT